MKLKEPLMPLYVYANRGWVCSTIISGVGASMYYAFAIGRLSLLLDICVINRVVQSGHLWLHCYTPMEQDP